MADVTEHLMTISPSQNALYIDGPKTLASFDGAFRAEIADVCASVDIAILAVSEAWSLASTFADEKKLREGQYLALLSKILNDIVAAIEMLRLGYYAATHALMRGIIEGTCMAVLIRLDANIHQNYVDGFYSVNKSVACILRRLKCADLDGLKKMHQWYHKYAHPSAQAVAENILDYTPAKPVGGIYDPEKTEYYRKHLDNLKNVAVTIQKLLDKHYPDLKLKCNEAK